MTPPRNLWARATMVVRPRDLRDVYARPDLEVRRLAGHALRPVATGYWAIPPIERLDDPDWRPEIEALALGLAVADYGVKATALMAASAARFHGALPRALGTAVVAVPKQRPALDTTFGRIVFVKRQTNRLELTRARTPMVTGYATTVEQTMLDIAHRPTLGDLATTEAAEAIRALALRADWTETLALAKDQRIPAAYVRARWVAESVVPEDTPILRPRTPVPGLNLRPADDDARRFGIQES